MSEEKRMTRSQTEREKVQLPGDLAEQIATMMHTKLVEHDERVQRSFEDQMHALQEQIRNVTDLVMDSKQASGQNHARGPAPGATGASPCGKERRIPQSFDGGSSWGAYLTQFKIIANQNGWNDDEKAMQLAASLKGPALELLGHLPEDQCKDFKKLAEALNQRFGVEHQEEAFRAQFRTRARRPQEPLAELAQDIERLAFLAYPSAPAEFRGILIRDQFIDALDDTELKISIRQTRPPALKDALSCALEMESIRRSVKPADTAGGGTSGFKTRVANTGTENTSHESILHQIVQTLERIERRQRSTGERTGSADEGSGGDRRRRDMSCWNCGRRGHLQRNCRLPIRSAGNQRAEQIEQASKPGN